VSYVVQLFFLGVAVMALVQSSREQRRDLCLIWLLIGIAMCATSISVSTNRKLDAICASIPSCATPGTEERE
jgi:hypothetical protein